MAALETSLLINSEEEPEQVVCSSLTPGRPLFRYAILIGCCLLTFGSYFSYDIPAALECQLESLYDVSALGYEMLYTVYSVPNMVLPFCGGWLVDRVFGLRVGGMVFCGLVTLGQIVFASSTLLGAFDLEGIHQGYIMAVVGRVIFGLGGESLSVVQSTYCAKWFAGKELALAFGITLSFSRIGSALNFIVVPVIAKYLSDESTWIATWLGALLCGVSVTACLCLAFLDRRGDAVSKEEKKVQADEKISLTDVFYFPITIWFVYVICISFYVSIFTFITIATTFFSYKFDSAYAGVITAIPYTSSAFLSPVGGFLVDKFGHSISWVFGASCLVAAAHCLMLLAEGSWAWVPWLSMTVIGIAYSICAASLWPCVPLIVKQHQLGTAYGLMTSLQNMGLAAAPLIVGILNSSGSTDPCAPESEQTDPMSNTDPSAFNSSMLFLIGCASIAALLSLILIIIDWMQKGILNAPSATVRARLAEVEEEEKEEIASKELEPDEEVVKSDAAKLIGPRSHLHVRNAYLMKVGIMPATVGITTSRRSYSSDA